LKDKLVAYLKSLKGGANLLEKDVFSTIALEHASQVAANPKDTDFKIKANYVPVAQTALITRILQAGVFPGDGAFNGFFSTNSEADALQRIANVTRNIPISTYTHFGIGVVKTNLQWFVSLMMITEIIQLQGIEIELASTGSRKIQGQIVNGSFSNPSGLVTLPAGTVEEVALQSNGKAFSLEFLFHQQAIIALKLM
jgi:hypothetical protein